MSTQKKPLNRRRKRGDAIVSTFEDHVGDVTVLADMLVKDGIASLVRLTFVAPEDGMITAQHLRAFSISQTTGRALLEDDSAINDQFRVERPDKTKAWYENFARVFASARAVSKSPARMIADVSGVPVSAVHRWTHEARRRGHLTPDPRGPKSI